MTAFIEFFCNTCNPSAQRREEGDELTTGYNRSLATGASSSLAPAGWRQVRGLGPGDFGHVCGDCIAKDKVPAADYAPPPTTLEKHDSGWPSRSSPFGS